MKKDYERSAYNKYYTASSEAYALQSLPNYEEEPIIRRRKVRKKSKKGKVQYRHHIIKEMHFSLMGMLTISTIFLCCLLSTVFFAKTMKIQLGISQLNNQIKKAEEDNSTLASQLALGYDLAEIEKIATSKFNMQKPQSYQMKHIVVPRESYVVRDYNAVVTEKESLFSLDKFWDFIKLK